MVVHKTQLGLRLSQLWITLERLIQCTNESGFHKDVVIEEQKVGCPKFTDCHLRGGIAPPGNAEIAFAVVG
jgi:hypothetical protein